MQRLTRRARRVHLVLHVTASVGWLGVTLCLLALSVTAATTGSDAATEASYRSMKVFGDWLIGPLALVTLATGLVLSLRGHWGLARHRWVYTKFWITVAAILATLFVFRTSIDRAVAATTAGEPVELSGMLAPPLVSLAAYVFMTVVSLLKPWGLTARGRRARAARGTSGTAGSRAAAGSGSGPSAGSGSGAYARRPPAT